jgi:hypothetical protein
MRLETLTVWLLPGWLSGVSRRFCFHRYAFDINGTPKYVTFAMTGEAAISLARLLSY